MEQSDRLAPARYEERHVAEIRQSFVGPARIADIEKLLRTARSAGAPDDGTLMQHGDTVYLSWDAQPFQERDLKHGSEDHKRGPGDE